jgi:hypothetical protein
LPRSPALSALACSRQPPPCSDRSWAAARRLCTASQGARGEGRGARARRRAKLSVRAHRPPLVSSRTPRPARVRAHASGPGRMTKQPIHRPVLSKPCGLNCFDDSPTPLPRCCCCVARATIHACWPVLPRLTRQWPAPRFCPPAAAPVLLCAGLVHKSAGTRRRCAPRDEADAPHTSVGCAGCASAGVRFPHGP